MRFKRFWGARTRSPNPEPKRKGLAIATTAALVLGLNFSLPAGVLADDETADNADPVVATEVVGEATTEAVTDEATEETPAPEVEAPKEAAPAPAPEASDKDAVETDTAPTEAEASTPEAPATETEAEETVEVMADAQCQVVEHNQWANLAGAWQNGNLNGNNSAYAEGDWVPRRAIVDIQTPGEPATVVVQIDKIVNGKYAFDALRVDSGATIIGIQNNGATINYTLQFAADTAGPHTILFSTHIASELDYGPGMGAGSINGSPYHTRIIELSCGNVGQQDRSMKSDAVKAGNITIVKKADPADGTKFNFALTSPYASTSDIYLADGESVTYRVGVGEATVTENVPAGWELYDVSCVGGAGATYNGSTATVPVADGDNWVCTFTNMLPKYEDLVVTKTATASYTAKFNWGIEKTAEPASTIVMPGGSALIAYTVKVSELGIDYSAAQVTGQISIENPNGVAIEIVDVTDAVDNGGTCTLTAPTSVPALSTVSVNYTCTYPDGAIPADGTNTATVSYKPLYGMSDSPAVATAPVLFTEATVTEIDKTVTIKDNKFTFDPEWTLTYGDADNVYEKTYEVNVPAPEGAEDGRCYKVVNVASVWGDLPDNPIVEDDATVEICVEADLTGIKSLSPSLTRTYDWDIEKTLVEDSVVIDPETGKGTADYSIVVTPGEFTDSDFALTGWIRVTNPNDWTVDYKVSDTFVGADGETYTCTIEGEPFQEGSLGKGGFTEFEYSCDLPADFVGAAGDKNTVTVEWGDGKSTTSEFAVDWWEDLNTDITEVHKEIVVKDYFNGADDGVIVHPDATLQWRDGEPYTFTYTGEFQIDPGTCEVVNNLVKIEGTDWQDHVTDEWCNPADVFGVKSIEPSFTRTYDWDISKSVVKDSVTIDPITGKGSADYKVVVTPGGFVDSDFALTGTLVVMNPNAWDVDYVASDVFIAGDETEIQCSIDGMDEVSGTLPPGTVEDPSIAEFTYECSFPEDFTPSEDDVNTIVVQYGDEDATVSVVPVDWYSDAVDVTEVHGTIEVADYFNGSEEATFVWELEWNADGTPYEKVYTGEFQVDPGTCEVVTNYVEIVGTDWNDMTENEWCLAAPEKPGKPPVKPKPEMPVTGEDSGLLAMLALMSILGGAVGIAATRKRHA